MPNTSSELFFGILYEDIEKEIIIGLHVYLWADKAGTLRQ
jgi:hypothetical protein